MTTDPKSTDDTRPGRRRSKTQTSLAVALEEPPEAASKDDRLLKIFEGMAVAFKELAKLIEHTHETAQERDTATELDNRVTRRSTRISGILILFLIGVQSYWIHVATDQQSDAIEVNGSIAADTKALLMEMRSDLEASTRSVVAMNQLSVID